MNMFKYFRESLASTVFAFGLAAIAAYRLVWTDMGPVGVWGNVIQILIGVVLLTLVALGKSRREPPET